MIKKLLIVFICIALSLACALSAEAAKVKVDIGFFGIDYSIKSKQGYISPGLFSGTLGYETKLIWEFKQVNTDVYHVRMPLEKDIFLKLDSGTKQVFIVSGGTFGKESGSEKIFQNAVFIEFPPPMKPDPDRLMVRLPKPELIYDTDTNDVEISSAGFRLMGPEEIEIVKAEEDIYHVRARGTRGSKTMPNTFRVLNIATKTLSTVGNGRFGESVAGAMQIDYKVTIENGKSAAPEPDVHKDLGMAELRKERIRESAWVAAEQELYHDLLSKQQFDVLVVPFQVQDNAFDHIERSVMTRYLVHQIRSTTNLRVADPDIVERALGWGYRTFSQQQTYDLANALKAVKLIRIFVGHNRDMKMRLTAVIQDRLQGANFDTATKTRNIVLKDIVFSDEKLPSDAFAAMLPSIMDGLRIKENRKDTLKEMAGLKNVPLPLTPMALVQSQEKSPLIRAAYLAMLSSLSPAESRTSERFLTHSLMLLRDVKPNLPDVIFLKAYAFSMLYRRPAALELLRKPSTPEQTALRSYLDGDLSALSALVEKIQSPIPKLLIQNALNDLRWSYDYQTARQRASEVLQYIPMGWQIFCTRRYSLADPWDVPSVIELKKYLDDIYPVNGYALQDIARGLAVRGDFNSGDIVKINISVPEHCKRLLKDRPELLSGDPLDQIRQLDIIDLVEEWAEKSIFKLINLPVNVQALWEEGVATADRYDVYFKGHPELSELKSIAIYKLAKLRDGAERKNLWNTLGELSFAACIWFQGQSRSANTACSSKMFYDNDFPRREFWRRYYESFRYGDRDEYELRETIVTSPVPTGPLRPDPYVVFKSELRDHDLALRYTISEFYRFEQYYDILVSKGMLSEADALNERNKRRFVGKPARTAFMAKQYESKSNEQGIKKLYEEAFRIVPGVWQSYYELGYHYLYRGDTHLARDTFKRYPLFYNKDEKSAADSEDTVTLSNNAYGAGKALHWTGATVDAKPFFELSAGYQTGSGSGMHSEYLLALYDGNYQRAAEIALSLGRRYSDTDAFVDYLRILRISGNVQEAEQLYFNLNMMDSEFIDWSPIITDLRMAGKNDEEVRGWLVKHGNGKLKRKQAQLFYLQSLLVDRKPDPSFADMVDNIQKHAPLLENERVPIRVNDVQGRVIQSNASLFAGSWNSVWLGQYDKVLGLLEPWWFHAQHSRVKDEERALLPYFVWSRAHASKEQKIDEILTIYQKKNGRDFEYWLATAIVQASAGKHEEALKSLDLARNNIHSSLSDVRPIQAWYQLVDACELLFEDTQVDAYRDRALELARLYQRVQPLDSWAYAVEAKLAKTEEDRLRPLALTLYLDKQSYHIEGVSKNEKEQALKWLEKNNPFLKKEQEIRKKQI
jgi:tetratricopeptide (TPR) repeat protein